MASKWERRLKQKEVLDMFDLFRHSWPNLWVPSFLRCTMATCRNQEWDGDARKGQRGQREGGRATSANSNTTVTTEDMSQWLLRRGSPYRQQFHKMGAFGFAFLVMVKAEFAQSARARRNDQPASRLVSRVPHKFGNLRKSVMDLKLEFVETEPPGGCAWYLSPTLES
jgi:hypothetical protein